MHLDRMKTLSLISALALSLAYGCSSKKNNDDDVVGTGGTGFQLSTGGASSTAGGSKQVDPTYCDGLLTGLNCGQSSFEADIRTVNMLLVLDQSGSMDKPPSSATTNTKWAEMKTALAAAMKAVSKDINFGLMLFPYSGDLAQPIDPKSQDLTVMCNVPITADPNAAVAVGIENGVDKLQTILDVVGASVPAGGTPTAKALDQAYAYFTVGGGKDLPGSKWVLLATDGGPNCNPNHEPCEAQQCTQNIDCNCTDKANCSMAVNCCAPSSAQQTESLCLDDVEVVKQIERLAAAQIDTFVVGIPGTEAYADTLNRMAIAGQKPNTTSANGESYYAVSASNSVQGLTDAFAEITTQLLKSCDMELKETPLSGQVIVAMDCQKLPEVPSATPDTGGDSGFYIDYSQSPAHLRLTGSYCEQISSLGAKNLDVILGCQAIN